MESNKEKKKITSKQVIEAIIFLLIMSVIFVTFVKDDSASEQEAKSAKNLERRKAGFHCLSEWNGSNSSVISAVKSQLKDPSSFEHVETKITPENNAGEHTLFMKYRAKNSFGGYIIGTAQAIIKNHDCSATIVTYE